MTAMPLSLSQIPLGSPWWMFAVAGAGLAFHVGAGLVGIGSGYAAVTVTKGGALHRRFGKIFVASMLVMAVVATGLAFNISQPNNVGGGFLAAYLVSTAWMTVRRQENTIGLFEKLACVTVLGTATMFFIWGLQAAASPTGALYGYRPVLYFVIGSIAALLGAVDIRVIRLGGLSGAARISRHIWRMCFAFFFAAGSFFIGQQKVMPVWMHGSPVLWVLGLAPLGFMAFWLVRVRMKNSFRTVQQVS